METTELRISHEDRTRDIWPMILTAVFVSTTLLITAACALLIHEDHCKAQIELAQITTQAATYIEGQKTEQARIEHITWMDRVRLYLATQQ